MRMRTTVIQMKHSRWNGKFLKSRKLIIENWVISTYSSVVGLTWNTQVYTNHCQPRPQHRKSYKTSTHCLHECLHIFSRYLNMHRRHSKLRKHLFTPLQFAGWKPRNFKFTLIRCRSEGISKIQAKPTIIKKHGFSQLSKSDIKLFIENVYWNGVLLKKDSLCYSIFQMHLHI